jgi:metal-responsive CopG/Arc/MetJ family transcriptional regulator
MMIACLVYVQSGGRMIQPNRGDKLIQIRAPECLAKALDSAADKRLTSRSDYIRVALLDRLRADGIDHSDLTSFGAI